MGFAKSSNPTRRSKSQMKKQKVQKAQLFRHQPKGFNEEPSFEQFESRPKIDSTPLTPKTENQKRYLAAMKSFVLTFGIGAAGTGKTYVAGAYAAQLLQSKQIEKLIITRPVVEAGESLGFLPGELEEKYEPYIVPFRQVLEERLGKSFVQYMIKTGKIEAVPLAFMRGRTFKNCMVIFDEAQNSTPVQMKMFLTRIGEECKVVINGDETQKDIPGLSGLTDAVNRCSWIPSVKTVRFSDADVVRSGIVRDVLKSYETAPAAI